MSRPGCPGIVAISLLPFLSTLNQLDYLETRHQTPDIKLSPLMLLTTAMAGPKRTGPRSVSTSPRSQPQSVTRRL